MNKIFFKKFTCHCVFLLMGLSSSFNALSVGLDTLTVLIPPNESQITQRFYNPDKENAHVISISLTRIKSPYDMTPVENVSSQEEVLYSPTQTILQSGEESRLKIKYNGPSDNKERYYAINWRDSLLSAEGVENDSAKSAQALSSIALSTVLVVNPRNSELKYQFIGSNRLRNTGNTSFRVDYNGPCIKKGKEERCKGYEYFAPGKEIVIKSVDMDDPKSNIYMWKDGITQSLER